MAEFSKEYIERNNIKTGWGFSIQYEFSKLKDNHQKYLCCEGFGFVGVREENGRCLLIYPDGKNSRFGIKKQRPGTTPDVNQSTPNY